MARYIQSTSVWLQLILWQKGTDLKTHCFTGFFQEILAIWDLLWMKDSLNSDAYLLIAYALQVPPTSPSQNEQVSRYWVLRSWSCTFVNYTEGAPSPLSLCSQHFQPWLKLTSSKLASPFKFAAAKLTCFELTSKHSPIFQSSWVRYWRLVTNVLWTLM